MHLLKLLYYIPVKKKDHCKVFRTIAILANYMYRKIRINISQQQAKRIKLNNE